MHEPQELAMRQVAGTVLATHPEGQSLLAEAGHRRALAEQSAAAVTQAFSAMQAFRLGYEELRHRLDPRCTRTVRVGIALTLLTAIFAALLALDAIEFAGVLSGWLATAAAATAAWTGCAWLAALAGREKRFGQLAAVIAGAAVVDVLLAALHGEMAFSGRAVAPWTRFGVGILAALLIFALVAAAAVLIMRTEPASLLPARRRWRRSCSDYSAAVRTRRSDAEADAVADQGWRNLIKVQAGAGEGSGLAQRAGPDPH